MDIPRIESIESKKDIVIITTEDFSEYEELKKSHMDKKDIIIHSGSFHPDEAMTCALLKYTKLTQSKMLIIRTRCEKIMKAGFLVADVGRLYDPPKLRFDHHQKEFTESYSEDYKFKMSSCGQIYKHMGEEIIKCILEGWGMYSQELGEYVHPRIYKDLIASIDGPDNGVSQYSTKFPPKFTIHTDLAHRVSRLNPNWQQKGDINVQFTKAVELCEEELLAHVFGKSKVVYPAYDVVKAAFLSRKDIHPSGKLLLLSPSCPWREHLFSLERELKLEGEVLFVCFENDKEEWMLQAVPKDPSTFENRCPLPVEWRGLSQTDLVLASGLKTAKFVHVTGFLALCVDKADTLQMAQITIQRFIAQKEEEKAEKEKGEGKEEIKEMKP